MPKMPKVEARLRRIDFIKTKQQGMLLYSLTDFWFCMLKISGVYNKDGAKRRQNFRHFSGLSGYSRFNYSTIYLIN